MGNKFVGLVGAFAVYNASMSAAQLATICGAPPARKTLLPEPSLGRGDSSGAAAGTCDFRLAEENKISAWGAQLRQLGISGNSSVTVQAGLGPPRGPNATANLERFYAATRQELLDNVRMHLLPTLGNDTQWGGLLTLDLEQEVRPDFFHAFDDEKLAAVVAAMRLRVSVLREVFPIANVSMYATPSPFENLTGIPHPQVINTSARFAQAAQGYARASKLGLFDDMAFTTPSLYMGPGWNITQLTAAVLRLADSVTTSAGRVLPMAPYLSWVWFGGGKAVGLRCEEPHAVMAKQVQMLLALGSERVPIVQWWLGKDGWPSCPQSCVSQGLCTQNETQLAFFQRGAYVPERCLAAQGSN